MKRFLYLAPILLLTMLSCESMGLVGTNLRTEVLVVQDEFEPTVKVYSSEHQVPSNALGGGKQFIRAFIHKETNDLLHQLYVEHVYLSGNWRFYERAYLSGGIELELVKISSDVKVTANAFYETFGITIPDDYIRSHPNGFSVKVIASQGEDVIIEITAIQLTEYLQTIDRLTQ
jgi:hypothetical protein